MKAAQIIQGVERKIDRVGWEVVARRNGLTEEHLRAGLRGKQGRGPNLNFLERVLNSLQLRMVLTYRIDRTEWTHEPTEYGPVRVKPLRAVEEGAS